MKLWLSLLLALCFANPVWAALSTDSFTRADNADLGAAWDVYATSPCKIVSNAVEATTAPTTRCVEGYNTYIPINNQYALAVINSIVNTGGTTDVATAVRVAAPPTYSGYFCRAQVGAVTSIIQRRDSGSGTDIASESATTWVAGDIVECEAFGTTISFFINFGALLAVTDATYTSGRTGLALTANNLGEAALDNFEMGDLGVAAVVRHRVIVLQ